MPRIDEDAYRQVQKALERYALEVQDSNLTLKTQHTYIHHASTFVRWLNYDFTPGSGLATEHLQVNTEVKKS